MKDKTLFPLPPATGNLNDKQQAVLAYLQHGPSRAIDVGRHLHELDNCQYCNPERTCRFAYPNAVSVLESLGTQTDANPRGRNLVIKRKTGLWELLPGARTRDTGEFPDSY